MNIFDLERFSEDAFRVKLTYVDICGDLNAGILLGQIIYWFLPNKNGKSKLRASYKGRPAIAKARNEWHEEIRLTERQYDRAISILKEKGFVDVENSMFNGSRTPFIMLNEDVVMSEIIGVDKSVTSVLHSSGDRYNTLSNIGIYESVIPLTETTTKTTTDINNNIITSKEDDGKVTNATKQMNEDIRKIFDYWNSKNITVHQKFTEPMKSRLRTVVKNYGIQELLTVINNYATVYHSDKHYFNYKYTLMQITRTKDMDQFGSEADPLHNFLKDKGGNNSYAAKRESDLMAGRTRRALH